MNEEAISKVSVARVSKHDEPMRFRRRHNRMYWFGTRIILPFVKRRLNLEAIPAPAIEGPFLLLANHNLNLDPAIIHLSFDRLLYFVASEHVLRKGLGAWFLKRYFAPIPRLKGSTDIGTVKGVLSRLKHHVGVCIFAEGNRSFNGITGPIPSSIAKLAKVCRVPVLTYRFEGGYFTSPRWSKYLRRGKMKAYVVHVYQPEQLAAMSTDELQRAIEADLFEDAYARQKASPIAFKGKAIAEALESTLYYCPACHSIGTMRSEDDRLTCTCGLTVHYDLYGHLQGGKHETITAWDFEQQAFLGDLLNKADSAEEILHDTGITLKEVFRDGSETLRLKDAELTLTIDRLVCSAYDFEIKSISDMALAGRNKIIFTYGERFFEISATPQFSGKKYFDAYQLIRKKG